MSLGGQRSEFVFEPDRYTGKKTQVVLPGPKIDPATAADRRRREVDAGPGVRVGHLDVLDRAAPRRGPRRFLQRVAPLLPARAEERRSGSSRRSPRGRGSTSGDQIEVQVSLRSKHEAEYVHLRDPRAAGFEPESPVSRWKWDLGIAWYEETRDSGTNFFFEKLPVGRVHVPLPPARGHGRSFRGRPGDGAVDVRAGVQRLLGGHGDRDWIRFRSLSALAPSMDGGRPFGPRTRRFETIGLAVALYLTRTCS